MSARIRECALRLAGYAGACRGAYPLAPSMPRNALRLAAALVSRAPSVNLELAAARALAVRVDAWTSRDAEDVVRSCEAALDDGD